MSLSIHVLTCLAVVCLFVHLTYSTDRNQQRPNQRSTTKLPRAGDEGQRSRPRPDTTQPPRPLGTQGSTQPVFQERVHYVPSGAGTRLRYYDDETEGYVSEWAEEWGVAEAMDGPISGAVGAGSKLGLHAKCISIPANMSLCRGIGYEEMRLPNLLDHDSVGEATHQAVSWVPLLNIHCHPDTRMFLCSLFAPVCLDRPIWPCRTLCEAVKEGCESRMSKYGYPWPDMLRCDKFPLDNDLCIGVQNDNKPDETSCPACAQPDTFENIVDNFCNAEFVMRATLEETLVSGNEMKLIVSRKKRKMFKRGTMTSKELRDVTLYIEQGAKCRCARLEDVDGTVSGRPTSTRRGPAKKTIIAMGQKKHGRLTLSFVQLLDSRSKETARALTAFRRNSTCGSGTIKAIAGVEGERSGKEKDGNNEKGRDKVKIRDKERNAKKEDGKGGGRRNREKNGNAEERSRKRQTMVTTNAPTTTMMTTPVPTIAMTTTTSSRRVTTTSKRRLSGLMTDVAVSPRTTPQSSKQPGERKDKPKSSRPSA